MWVNFKEQMFPAQVNGACQPVINKETFLFYFHIKDFELL